jgi:alanine racemase
MWGPKAKIHLDRLVANYRLIQEQVGRRKVMAVVKANAYGHGAVPVTKALQAAGVDFFAVFSFDEAVELREAGIQDDILIFSRMSDDILAEAQARNITLNLSWPDDLERLKAFHARHGTAPVVHLKVDTGMTRLGVDYDEIIPLLHQLAAAPEIRCEGIYSHYATADEGDLSYAEYQLSRFNQVVAKARELGLQFRYVHFSNSGAVLNLPDSWFNMVRVGMLLYGAFPSDEVPRELPIQPVMEFVAPVVTVRRVAAGTQVSYGGVYTTDRDTNIGVIQCGFADGFPRPWYVDGWVVYRGQNYKIAGRVCMDQFMVDFGDCRPEIGDEVLLFGKNEHGTLRVDEIAGKINSTTYVLLTAIGGRTQREFLQ